MPELIPVLSAEEIDLLVSDLAQRISSDYQGRDVLLVEDIVDTGLTIDYLLDYLRSFQPRSVAACALINKRERREREVPVAYVGRGIESGFLVGYGLDYAEDYRHLPGIFHLKL